MSDQASRNKQTAIAFHDPMFSQCRMAEAVRHHVGDRCIRRNPVLADGKACFERMARDHHCNPRLGRHRELKAAENYGGFTPRHLAIARHSQVVRPYPPGGAACPPRSN